MLKKTLFSGIKPSGKLHLGNYLGAVKNWAELQKKYKAVYSIVDLHALTQEISADELREHTHDLAVDLLSCGINPKQSILFRQSDVHEHLELAWIFSCLTPVPELERMTQYKDLAGERKRSANAGLLTYPILQSADILLYRAEVVPVGEDQLQHLELSRVIARKFNNHYKKYFPEVTALTSDVVRLMSLTNPEKKMSKSLGEKSYIALRDKPEVVKSKIAKAVTDSLDDSSTLSGGHNLLMLFKAFGSTAQFTKFERAFELKKISYAELKSALADAIVHFLEPIQKKQAYYDSHPKEVDQILARGAQQASKIAQETMKDVRELVGLN